MKGSPFHPNLVNHLSIARNLAKQQLSYLFSTSFKPFFGFVSGRSDGAPGMLDRPGRGARRRAATPALGPEVR